MKILSYDTLEPGALLMRSMQRFDVSEPVRNIIEDVAGRGNAALFDYSERFDRVRLSSLEVSAREIDEAVASVSSELMDAMALAAENIREFHSRQLREGFTMTRSGVVMGQKITPIEKVGLYIPGGTAAYPSTVLMLAIPAKLAGCSQIVITTPPGKDGKVAAPILAAAKLAGVDQIFKVGGAQAVAALAYGTETVPKVDKIVGPGNAYVAEAKKQVFGRVAIDVVAGPSEVLMVADAGADPVVAAADLLAQAEHDVLSSAVLVTDSPELAKAVQREIERQLKLLPRLSIAGPSIENNGKIILTESIAQAIEVANEIAPEHLELNLAEPFAWLDKVKNAGSIFLGRNAPEALGDYLAGPNHTLPTGGIAKFASPLSVNDFVKRSQFTYFSREALEKVSGHIAVFARKEGLEGHARSALVRFDESVIQ